MATRFVDDRGMEWEVWEVGARRRMADFPPPLRASSAREVTWLCFESATQRRRLAQYPSWWQALPPRELQALCNAARPERPSPPPGGAVRTTGAR